MPRFYTVGEANAMVPQLSELLETMRAHARQLAAIQARSLELSDAIKNNGHQNPTAGELASRASARLEVDIHGGIEKLAEWGIELKDLGTGLVDFPALRHGRTVYLCWRLGEPEVAYWHETDAGFAGRQPLDKEFS